MKITDLIHEQTCKIDSIEEKLRNESSYLIALQNLQVVINEYKKENPSIKFYPWAVNRGETMDFDCDIMDIITNVDLEI